MLRACYQGLKPLPNNLVDAMHLFYNVNHLFFKCFKRITYHLWKRYNLG